MKRLYTFLLLTLCTLALWAKPWSAESLPPLDNTTRVSNPDGVLNQWAIDSINTMLLSVDKHNVQCLVVVVKNIENDDPYEFAIGLGRRFGVGGKKNLGVVIVLASDDRSYQIVTGDGMEKFLPDAICARIENRAMLPYLREGDWDNAMVAAIKMMKGYLDEEPEIMEQLRGEDDDCEDDDISWFLGLLFFGGIAFLFVSAIISAIIESKCPKCGKHKVKTVSSKKLEEKNGWIYYLETRKCTACQHTFTKKTKHAVHTNSSTGGSRYYGGGSSRSYSSSSHSSGGFSSFGGGSFSGGGAGGRF